jgi:carbonic anhydrase
MKRSFCLLALVVISYYSVFAQQPDNNSLHHSSHAGSQPKPSADEIWASLMAIKENVHQSVKDVLANSAILSEAVHSGKLQVVEAKYSFDSGRVVPRLIVQRTKLKLYL